MLDRFQDSAKMTDMLPEFECRQSAPTERFEAYRTVRFSETGIYGHLNNTCYFEWLADELEHRYPDHGFLKAA